MITLWGPCGCAAYFVLETCLQSYNQWKVRLSSCNSRPFPPHATASRSTTDMVFLCCTWLEACCPAAHASQGSVVQPLQVQFLLTEDISCSHWILAWPLPTADASEGNLPSIQHQFIYLFWGVEIVFDSIPIRGLSSSTFRIHTLLEDAVLTCSDSGNWLYREP